MKDYLIDFGIVLHCSAKIKGDSIKEAFDNFTEKSESEIVKGLIDGDFDILDVSVKFR
tara:strand:- start:15082 stop:15255 length:174 start_codon:yes stop_codon:yes gene_type:complete